MELYYREKILALHDTLFEATGDGRDRLLKSENKIQNAFLASNSAAVPLEIKKQWETIMKELEKDNPLIVDNELFYSSMKMTLSKKKNKTMSKYLSFFNQEFYRVI